MIPKKTQAPCALAIVSKMPSQPWMILLTRIQGLQITHGPRIRTLEFVWRTLLSLIRSSASGRNPCPLPLLLGLRALLLDPGVVLVEHALLGPAKAPRGPPLRLLHATAWHRAQTRPVNRPTMPKLTLLTCAAWQGMRTKTSLAFKMQKRQRL